MAAACGSSREDEDAGASSTSAPASAPDAENSFGSLESPCGDGDAEGATDQGVTDDAIKIGYGDDAGFTGSPGLGHELTDAVEALISWCNDQGGINGRPIEGSYYDARITESVNVMTTACQKEFFLVGQLFALDQAAEPVRRECGLPTVPASAVSPQVTNAPLKFEPSPNPLDFWAMSDAYHLKKLFPEAIKRSAMLYANYPTVLITRDKVVPTFEAAGYDFTCEAQYNILGEPDWKPVVQKLKQCGAELVKWIGAPYPNFQNVLEAAAQLEFDPIWLADPNAYDDGFAKWNTNGYGDKVYFKLQFTPLFEADDNPATQAYLDIVEASGGDVSGLGQYAASAFLLWATAADSCGSDLTRKCVLEALAGTHDWTAGGLQAPADVGSNSGSDCGVLVKLTGTEFERVDPKKPDTFDCDPSYLAKITGRLLTENKLDPDRIVQL